MRVQAGLGLLQVGRWIVVCALAAAVAACAFGPVPGGDTYALTVTSKENTLMAGEGGEFTYGRYSRQFALNGGGGTRGVGDYVEFHVLQLKWTTASGVERHETIDIAPLIERMREERRINRFEGLRRLLVEVDGAGLVVFYEIVPFQGYVPKKGARRKYKLYQSAHN